MQERHLSMGDPWGDIACDWDGRPEVGDKTFGLATELVTALRAKGCLPEAAGVGYWPTIRLVWGGGTCEIEVFDDSFELTRLNAKGALGGFEVTEFDAKVPGAISALVVALLAGRAA
jgi:hypothetical protein